MNLQWTWFLPTVPAKAGPGDPAVPLAAALPRHCCLLHAHTCPQQTEATAIHRTLTAGCGWPCEGYLLASRRGWGAPREVSIRPWTLRTAESHRADGNPGPLPDLSWPLPLQAAGTVPPPPWPPALIPFRTAHRGHRHGRTKACRACGKPVNDERETQHTTLLSPQD